MGAMPDCPRITRAIGPRWTWLLVQIGGVLKMLRTSGSGLHAICCSVAGIFIVFPSA
jgi:hypothetical protein